MQVNEEMVWVFENHEKGKKFEATFNLLWKNAGEHSTEWKIDLQEGEREVKRVPLADPFDPVQMKYTYSFAVV